MNGRKSHEPDCNSVSSTYFVIPRDRLRRALHSVNVKPWPSRDAAAGKKRDRGTAVGWGNEGAPKAQKWAEWLSSKWRGFLDSGRRATEPQAQRSCRRLIGCACSNRLQRVLAGGPAHQQIRSL